MYYRSDKDSGCIYIYDGRGGNDPIHKIEKLHYKPVIIMKVRGQYYVWLDCVIKNLVDKSDLECLAYWNGCTSCYIKLTDWWFSLKFHQSWF